MPSFTSYASPLLSFHVLTPPPTPQRMSDPGFGESLVKLLVLGHTRLDQVGLWLYGLDQMTHTHNLHLAPV